jgi:hypothetical protein
MSKILHVSVNVRDLLDSPREQKFALTWLTKTGGQRFLDVAEMRQALEDEIAQGHEFIPLAECGDFDFARGCRGHEVKPAASPEPRVLSEAEGPEAA